MNEMNKEQVLEIVDKCFHRFASIYRCEAVEEAERIIDSLYAMESTKKCNIKNFTECPYFQEFREGCADCVFRRDGLIDKSQPKLA